MNVDWFNDLFDEEYENIMNNVVQYFSHGYNGRNSDN
jgi:hypothetical protein